MEIFAILLGSIVDPFLWIFALWVFFKRSSAITALFFACTISIISFVIQATLSVAFDPGIAFQMAIFKAIASMLLLLPIAFFRKSNKEFATEE